MGSSARFDFNQAVADAKRDYPRETTYVTFIDLSSIDAAQQIRAWYEKRGDKFDTPQGKKELKKILKEIKKNKRGLCTRSSTLGPILITIDASIDGKGMKSASFRFNHELGHAVNLVIDKDLKSQRRDESQADCFAVLRGLQAGSLSPKEFVKIINGRTLICIRFGNKALGDFAHSTAPVLKALKKNLTALNPCAMTPEQIRKEARNYLAALI
jgi:hypothetical protein